jgi:hypothetical protein
MTTSLNSAIVRIRAANGTVIGTGFLVTGRHVLTCAHVVAQALALPDDALNTSQPQAEVHLDFPLVAPGQQLTARVVCWQPSLSDGGGDVAGLELINDPPAGSSPVLCWPKNLSVR